MQVQPEVKNAIKELPPAERVIAIALKGIYEQVKQILSEEKKQIDQNHLSFIDRFKQIQKKAATVIKGKSLAEEELVSDKGYFVSEEEKDKKGVMAEAPKLKDYWLKSIKNSQFKNLLNEADEKILSSIQEISTNVTTDSLEIKFQFSESESTSQGVFTRKLTLSNGAPVNYDGDKMKFKIPLQEGLFDALNNDTTDFHALTSIMNIVGQVINEIVPYSLEYYMGTCQNDDLDMDEFDEEIDEQDEEEDGEPEKKVKGE